MHSLILSFFKIFSLDFSFDFLVDFSAKPMEKKIREIRETKNGHTSSKSLRRTDETGVFES